MGLWNLSPALERERTPLVDQFRDLVEQGDAAFGTLRSAAAPAENYLNQSRNNFSRL
jgi:hypothetical protein